MHAGRPSFMAAALSLIAMYLASVGVNLAGAAVIIDFEDGTSHDSPIPSGHYAGLTFTNAVWIDTQFSFGTFGDGDWALGVDAGITSSNDWAFPGTTSPIGIGFATNVTSVSITAYDVGSNGARIEAYDAANVLIDSDQFIGTGSGNGSNVTFSVTGDISRIALRQVSNPGDSDGLGWDNLTYDSASAVPEPLSLSIWSIGALGCAIGAYRRRKRT